MNCTKCNNTGWIFYTDKDGYECARECDCVKQRQSLARLERSGLSDLLNKYTFDRYKADYGFQKELLTKAKNYLNEKDKWFVVLGQSGSGKSMICTAICGELLKKHEVRFMSWLTESVKLKQNVNNAEVYEPLMEDYKKCEVLYIDDFFKQDNACKPSSADIKLANEILNYRYNTNKRTLISSERLVKDLIEIDEAVVGRMVEKAEEYLTEIVGKEKNYRLKAFM
jgi:DNA replication protein DnaC